MRLLYLVLFVLPLSCNPSQKTSSPLLSSKTYTYKTTLPLHFTVESEGRHAQHPLVYDDNTPPDNKLTDAGAALGRVLFYDKNLSKNKTIACASCHKAELGFSDDQVRSTGFQKGLTRRHSMGLTNARFYQNGKFFWDQRAGTLEDQVLMPIQDPVEMGLNLQELESRVSNLTYYKPLFIAAFGSTDVSSKKVSKALAQFVRSMVSVNSKYDKGRAQVSKRRDPFPNFTDEENYGKMLFITPPFRNGGFGCFVCHQGEGFVAVQASTNALDAEISDMGYGEVIGLSTRDGHFKVPSLRNVEVRAPYMHDGRFGTLEEVIDHYSSGIKAVRNPRPPLFARRQFNMSDKQKAALIAFLKTLTDKEMLADPKFSDPFRR